MICNIWLRSLTPRSVFSSETCLFKYKSRRSRSCSKIRLAGLGQPPPLKHHVCLDPGKLHFSGFPSKMQVDGAITCDEATTAPGGGGGGTVREPVPALKGLPPREDTSRSSHALWLEHCGALQFCQVLRRSGRRHAATSSDVICVSGLTLRGNQQASKGT